MVVDVSLKIIKTLTSNFTTYLQNYLGESGFTQGFNKTVLNSVSRARPDGFVSCKSSNSVKLIPHAENDSSLVMLDPLILLNIEEKLSDKASSQLTDAIEELQMKFQPSPHTLFCSIGVTLSVRKNNTSDYSIWLVCPFACKPDNKTKGTVINIASDLQIDSENNILEQCAKFIAYVIAYTKSYNARTIYFPRTRADYIWNSVTAVDFTQLCLAESDCVKLA